MVIHLNCLSLDFVGLIFRKRSVLAKFWFWILLEYITINVTVGNRYIKLYTQETKIRSLSFDQFQTFEKQIRIHKNEVSSNSFCVNFKSQSNFCMMQS